jgi:hypothetical protein
MWIPLKKPITFSPSLAERANFVVRDKEEFVIG